MLRPSAAILGAQIALSAAIERRAVAGSDHDATTLDLLVRIAESGDGRLRAVDLCRQLQLSPGYVSRLIEQAELAGLVTRSVDPADRRSQPLGLTEQGRAVVDDFRPRLESVLRDVIFTPLDETELEHLIELLGRVEAAALAEIEHPPDDSDTGAQR